MICQQLSPGLVVIMVFDITVAVIQFLNLSKFTLTSDANITGHKIKSLLLLNTDCIRNYRRKKKNNREKQKIIPVSRGIQLCASWIDSLSQLNQKKLMCQNVSEKAPVLLSTKLLNNTVITKLLKENNSLITCTCKQNEILCLSTCV